MDLFTIYLVLFIPAALLVLQGLAFFRLKSLLKDNPEAQSTVQKDSMTYFGGVSFLVLGALIAVFCVYGLTTDKNILLPLIITFAIFSAIIFILYLALNLRKPNK